MISRGKQDLLASSCVSPYSYGYTHAVGSANSIHSEHLAKFCHYITELPGIISIHNYN